MELSRQADYAVRAMVELASVPGGTRVQTGDVARRQSIPASFLPRIVAALGKAQLVHTFRGREGGITLARDAAKINLLEVIRAVEGPFALNLCTYCPSRCERSSFCPVHPVWEQAQKQLDQLLGQTTLSDLAKPTPNAARRGHSQRRNS